jgi:hypothetical protein
MDKRILKRHKRQVARARERVRLSEPDLRTPEQVKAAREASRPASGRRNDPHPHYSRPAIRDHAGPATQSTAKAGIEP